MVDTCTGSASSVHPSVPTVTGKVFLLKNSLDVKKGATLFKMASMKKERGSQEMAVMV